MLHLGSHAQRRLFFVIMSSFFLSVDLVSGAGREAQLVRDIHPSDEPDGHVQHLTDVGGTLLFVATHPDYGPELWISNGSESETRLVEDIAPGPDTLQPWNLTHFDETLFFRGNDGVAGEELWRSDGTEAGTYMVKDINPSGEGNPDRFRIVNNLLFFAANDGTSGVELWRSDGTADGTSRVADINPGSGSSNVSRLIDVTSTLFFVADDGTTGRELWKSDGTASGTVRVKDIYTGTTESQIRDLVVLNGVLYFMANDGVHGQELWRSDGTATGTRMVADINPDEADDNIDLGKLTVSGELLFFRADDGIHSLELWKSDGTASGTSLVRDINPGTTPSSPSQLTDVAGMLFFSASDGVHGRELWKSDGTTGGTVLVEDINPGAARSDPLELMAFGSNLFFSANDGQNGRELWKSQGLEWDTMLVDDINPAGDSMPTWLTVSGDRLFFRADDGANGRELWSLSLQNTAPTVDAGGPYVISEGTTVNLNGQASDPDLDAMTYRWSASSGLCSFTDATVLQAELLCRDNGALTLTLTVTDTWDAVISDGASVTINNVAPAVQSFDTPAQPVLAGSPITITATFVEPGTDDNHTYTINWGDGTSTNGTLATGARTVSAAHSYRQSGDFPLSITITDDDGASDSAASTVSIFNSIWLPLLIR